MDDQLCPARILPLIVALCQAALVLIRRHPHPAQNFLVQQFDLLLPLCSWTGCDCASAGSSSSQCFPWPRVSLALPAAMLVTAPKLAAAAESVWFRAW